MATLKGSARAIKECNQQWDYTRSLSANILKISHKSEIFSMIILKQKLTAKILKDSIYLLFLFFEHMLHKKSIAIMKKKKYSTFRF